MNELEGRTLAKTIRAAVASDTAQLRQQSVVPTLGIVIATDEPDAQWYVRSLCKAAAACDIETKLVSLPANASDAVIANALEQLAVDTTVHGVILQTPLPVTANAETLVALIPPVKDVDGANPLSAGRLQAGLEAFAPATAAAVMALLDEYTIGSAGKHAVVIGRSLVVGKPVANLLLERDATVSICHSKTADLAAHTKQADILIVAAGRPGLLTADMVNPSAIVIDVGTNPLEDGRLVGDVDPAVASAAAGLTPVPGGVGPVTTAILLQHVLRAMALQIK